MLRPVVVERIHIDPKRSKTELGILAGEINWYEQESRKAVMLALQYKLEIGRRLMRAKKLLPHGKFRLWAQDQFGWTARHVQRHLILAENATHVSHLPADTSLRVALAFIRGLRSESGAENAPAELESGEQLEPIHIVGEIEPGTIDRDRLLAEFARLASELGAQKTRWKIR